MAPKKQEEMFITPCVIVYLAFGVRGCAGVREDERHPAPPCHYK